MGVVFPAMFAPGIVLHTAFPTNVHLAHILLGNMFGVGQGDLTTAAAIALPVITIIALNWRDLMLHAFDPAQAQVKAQVWAQVWVQVSSRACTPSFCTTDFCRSWP